MLQHVDDLCGRISVCTLQHPDELAKLRWSRSRSRLGFRVFPRPRLLAPRHPKSNNRQEHWYLLRLLLSPPDSIASCISRSEIARCPGRRNAPRKFALCEAGCEAGQAAPGSWFAQLLNACAVGSSIGKKNSIRISSSVTSRGVPRVAIAVNSRSEVASRRKWIGNTGL
jgi:hypothetical protein